MSKKDNDRNPMDDILRSDDGADTSPEDASAEDVNDDETLDAFLEEAGIDNDEVDDVEELLGGESDGDGDEADGGDDDTLDAFLEEADAVGDGDDDDGDDASPGEKKKRTRADSRRLRYGSLATAMTAGAVAVVVLINVVVTMLYNRFPVNWDLTEDSLYTLSEESKEVLKYVESAVDVVVFIDEISLTESGNEISSQLIETLKQYRMETGNLVNYKYIDLDKNPNMKSQYPNSAAGDILFEYEGRKESISYSDLYSQDTSTGATTSLVEQKMGATLMRVVSATTPNVAILTGYSENTNLISNITSLLEFYNFKVTQYNIVQNDSIPADYSLVVIPAPTVDYNEASLDALGEWMSEYGRHVMMVASSKAYCTELYKLIHVEYGIQVTQNMIYETDTGATMFSNPYTLYNTIKTDDLVGDYAGQSVLIPSSLSLEIDSQYGSDTESSYLGSRIITASNEAMLMPLSLALEDAADPGTDEDDADDSKDDKLIEPTDRPAVSMAYTRNYTIIDNEPAYRYALVCGSEDAFDLNYMYYFPAHNYAVARVLNRVTGNEIETNIAGVSLDPDQLKFSDEQVTVIWWVFVVVVPILLLGGGVAIFIRRRRL